MVGMLGGPRSRLAERLLLVAERSGSRSVDRRTQRPSHARYPWLSRSMDIRDSVLPDGPRLSRLEAALLVATEPLSARRLAQLADLGDGTQARALVGKLREKYERRGAAIQIDHVAGGYALYTRAEFSPWLRRFCGANAVIRLSSPAMETLSVVAYRQPVLRAEIEAIRGVQCGELLRQLMENDLLRIVGRSEELGRPFLYGTTNRFLQMFGLKSLDDLPSRPGLDGNVLRDVEKE